MEDNASLPPYVEGRVRNIRFGISTVEEIVIGILLEKLEEQVELADWTGLWEKWHYPLLVPICMLTIANGFSGGFRALVLCMSSISGSAISHPSQLANPFLGLPLESGKCESCGTSEAGKCEGHFGYIKLPIPIYHPSHVSELKHILSLLCLRCLRIKKGKVFHGQGYKGVANGVCSCLKAPRVEVQVKADKASEGALCLELKTSARVGLNNFWNFLDRFGFHHGGDSKRPLLPFEALQILKSLPEETKKKLAAKGLFPQIGFIMQCLPVPPNCLSVPDVSNGTTIMASDLSSSLLRKVLNKSDIINRSRFGCPNFESYQIEANDLQSAVAQYMLFRGTTQAPHDMTRRYGAVKEPKESSTKAWLEKMRTLFIRKGSGFSSRSVITGDAYKGMQEIGLPLEIAQKITFEEKVTTYNMERLQKLVDEKLCVTYRDGSTTYAIREGSKGHTYLKVGQVINRRIMDGDIVFINRPPSTHKHSLQAFSVYVHDDHTVKINPLICAPLGADFDGDCVHIFYPQSLEAKAEVLELFSVEKQIRSSHSGSLNLQLVQDSLLCLKLMFRTFFLEKASAQQLAMVVSEVLPEPALLRAYNSGPYWTVFQIFQSALPSSFDCSGDRHLISRSELLRINFNRDMIQSSFTEIVSSVLNDKGPEEAVMFFNKLQPLLMEILSLEGYTVGLNDFDIPREIKEEIEKKIQEIKPLLLHLRSNYNELVELQVESYLKKVKLPIVTRILRFSALGNLIDSKSDSSISKVVQQLGFLGLQLYDHGKFYTRNLVEDMNLHFQEKYSIKGFDYPAEAFGLLKSSFFQGLNPYEEMVHSISSREVLIRSSRGLTEPGTLFKSLMAILRDVVICYDGTARNLCSNSIIQFKYGQETENSPGSASLAGEPVGVLAATAVSNPAYKAVLDSSPSNSSSWESMKEILLSKVNFKNDIIDRKVILYLNDCFCGKKYCKENAAYLVLNCLKKVCLKDIALDFLIGYQRLPEISESLEVDAGFVGHIHLDKVRLKGLNRSLDDILYSCQEVTHRIGKKKSGGHFKGIQLLLSECCTLQQDCNGMLSELPCIQFFYKDRKAGVHDDSEGALKILAETIFPELLETLVNGDPRVGRAKIVWIDSDAATWIRNKGRLRKGEIAVEVVVEKDSAHSPGDAWGVVMDSCLPVIHLIDTTRSTPYGIQQIQKLLGISCAFDQSVQRLSTSIRMVTKGVLREHLMLVANSMTFSGDLIGFNASGYKALFHSLKVQVPFTAATLVRPVKCFEQAAERCHSDSLSSIVASCSWGRHVSIGTGTPFQFLWSKKKVDSKQDAVSDVYDFLQHASGIADDVHILEPVCSSEHNSGFGRSKFEDRVEVQQNEDNLGQENRKANWSCWGQAAAAEIKSNGWDVNNESKKSQSDQVPISNAWSSWDGKIDALSGETLQPSEITGTKSNVWSNACGDWNNNNSMKTHVLEPPKSSEFCGGKSWEDAGNANEQPKKLSDQSNAWVGWRSSNMESQAGESQSKTWGGWDNNKSETRENERDKLSTEEHNVSNSWNKIIQEEKQNSQSDQYASWGHWKSSGKGIEWGKDDKSNDTNCWDQSESYRSSEPGHSRIGSWNRTDAHQKHPAKSNQSSPWDSWKSSEVNCLDQSDDLSAKPDVWDTDNKGQSSSSPSFSRWGHQSPKSGENEKSSDIGGLNEDREQDQLNQPTRSPVWGSSAIEKPSDTTWNKNNAQDWSNRPTKAPGWGSSGKGDRRNLQNRLTQLPVGADGRNANGILTATGRRLDLFTCEEEEILKEVEPIMQSTKRIMHKPNYNDGERLSEEDQSWVLDNVFQYHPEKTSKISKEIDYIMVDQHPDYPGSRCFFVVSTNGHREDFSSLKCVENYVREKFPERAEAFNQKYFSKRRRPEGAS